MMFHKTKKDILHGNILQQMLLFFFPVFLGYLLQHLYGIIDSMVLGRMIGKEALAGVGGSATAIINVVLNLIAGITSATTVIVAQNYGKGSFQKVKDSVRTGMFVAVWTGALMTALLFLLSPRLLTMMDSPADTFKISLTYLYLYAASLIPYCIYQCGICVLRAIGDSKRPVYFILLTAAVKIGGDLLLAGVFKLGATGTSIATLLAHIACAIVILYIFRQTPDVYQFSLKEFGYESSILKYTFAIGIPFSIQSVMFAIPSVFIQSKLNSFGTDAVAAYSAYSAVDNLFWCYSNAIGAATLTLAGQNYGSGNIPRVRKIAACGVLMEVWGALAYGLCFYFLGDKILLLFTNEEAVLHLAKQMLDVISVSYIVYIFIEPLSQVLKACGEAKSTMIIATVTICFTRIAYVLLVPQLTPVYPIYAYPLSWILTSLCNLIYFFCDRKLKVRT